MAAIKPLRIDTNANTAQMQAGEFIAIAQGGTGSTTQVGAQTSLGLLPGTNVEAWSANLDNLALLSGTGFLVQTAANTFAERALTGSTRISITNTSGVAGSPVFDLNAYADAGGGTFLKFARDAQGFVSGTSAVVAADITGLVNTTYLKLDGSNGPMTGLLVLSADPVAALGAATKQYVDNNIQGLKPKPTARVATTAALPANTYSNGASGVGATLTATGNGTLTVDGVLTALGDVILVMNQASTFQNGLYTVTTAGAAGAAYVLTRHIDMDQATEFVGAFIPVDQEGTANKNTLWLNNYVSSFTVGTTAVSFTQLNGATALIAGNGVTISGNTISLNINPRLVFNSGILDLASGIATPGTYTKLTVDTYGRVTLGATAVPSDIGAQPVAAGLTSLSGLAGTGIVMSSATGTFVNRTLTVSSRLTVTPVDGSGNPLFDIATTGVTAGTYTSVTVNAQGQVTAASNVTVPNLQDVLTNGEASSVAIGRAMYISAAGYMRLAIGNSLATAQVVCLVGATSILSAASGAVIFDGILTAATAQWDAVTGQSGGLTFGATYFVSNTTAGAITSTAPTSGFVVPVGRALDTQRMNVSIGTVIQL
jgi:hypothetical protein